MQISARTTFTVESNTSCAKEDCKPERRHYFDQSILMRNWLTNQMLLLRHFQLQPATPTTPRRLRCHAAQQPKRHHYESFALGGLCHHLQTTKAVNLSLSQLPQQTGQWEISKIPESPFGTVNSELSASDPLLLENETTTSKLISTVIQNLQSRCVNSILHGRHGSHLKVKILTSAVLQEG